MTADLLITNARLLGDGHSGNDCIDVAIRNGVVTSVERGLPRSAAHVIDAAGGLVIGGLHDHHLHLVALAAQARSVHCGPPLDAEAFAGGLRDAARGSQEWIRGFGYFESVAGTLDRHVLDAIVSDAPVRVQHRSGTAWFINTAGLQRLGVLSDAGPEGIERGPDGVATGRLFRVDDWLRTQTASSVPDVAGTARELLAFGVGELTDATPARPGDTLLLDAVRRGDLAQRVHTMISPGNPATGALAVKLLLDERDPPSFDELCARISDAHSRNQPVAVHLTDRSTTWLALTAWEHVGVHRGDRVEHGAVLDPDAIERLREYRITVVTNPSLAAERGDDHHENTEPDDRPHLWRCGSLLDAGVRVLGGTDAPYGPANPWQVMADAVVRRSPSGHPIGSDRLATPQEALRLFCARPLVRVGGAADLVVLSVPSLTDALAAPYLPGLVTSTVIGGRPYQATAG